MSGRPINCASRSGGAWDAFRSPGLWVLLGALATLAVAGLCGVDELVQQALVAHSPGWVREMARDFGRVGRSECYIVPAVLLLLWWWLVRPDAGLRRACIWLLAAEAAGGVVTRVLKIGFGRRRPQYGGEFEFFSFHSKSNSFPSGHTVDVVAVATVLWFVYPPLRPLYVVWAVMMATSRVVSLDHFVADVATGALVGLVCALVLRPAVGAFIRYLAGRMAASKGE